MCYFEFRVLTVEKGWKSYTIKAKSKSTAIEKGFKELQKSRLSYGLKFECNLLGVFL